MCSSAYSLAEAGEEIFQKGARFLSLLQGAALQSGKYGKYGKSQELWMARGKQLYVHAALWECYKHGGVREADACFGSYEM